MSEYDDDVRLEDEFLNWCETMTGGGPGGSSRIYARLAFEAGRKAGWQLRGEYEAKLRTGTSVSLPAEPKKENA